MFVQRVLDWISPQEKLEETVVENKDECIEPLDIENNTEERRSKRTQPIYPSTGPDRNMADEIEKELLRLHEEKFQFVTFLEGGDICAEQQHPSNKNVDTTKTDHVGVCGDVIEKQRAPTLSPLSKKIFQKPWNEKKPSKRNIFTQTDSKMRHRRSVRRNSSTSRVEQETRAEKDVPESNNNRLKPKDCILNSDGSTKPEMISPKRTKAEISIHSSESPKEPLGNEIHSPKKTKENIAIHNSGVSTKSETISSKRTKAAISIHNPESPREPLRSVIPSPKKTKETIAIHCSEESAKSEVILHQKTKAAISIRSSESPKQPLRGTSFSPKRTKGMNFIHSSESPKEPLKSVICLPKRTKGIIDIHSSAIHSPEKQQSSFHSPKKTIEKIAIHCSQSPQKLLNTTYSPKETKENIANHNTESPKETLGSGIYSSSETEVVDLLHGHTPVSPKTEESIIPSRVLTLLREVAAQYPKEISLGLEVYGELLVLGTSNRFVLRRRAKANGVKEATSIISQTAIAKKHTVSFQVSSASRSVVVQYIRDPTSDMFQVGRHDRHPVDICVTNATGRKGVSRFACRLVIKRQDHHDARLYAAAFDASGNVFLGESGMSETDGDGMDGFTTNGVLLQHPGSEWREVSVRGRLYSLRSELGRRRRMNSETNVLRDGSLIDLCGVTLLWRTREGIMETPGEDCLVRMEGLLREMAPVYHNKARLLTGKVHDSGKNETFVFLSCGHAVSMEASLEEGMVCPECGRVGSVTSLCVGKERGFYADKGMPPSHAFRPCGHVSTRGTVRFWSGVRLPHDGRETGICPFCATRLHPVHKYVGLVYPRHCSDRLDERFLINTV